MHGFIISFPFRKLHFLLEDANISSKNVRRKREAMVKLKIMKPCEKYLFELFILNNNAIFCAFAG